MPALDELICFGKIGGQYTHYCLFLLEVGMHAIPLLIMIGSLKIATCMYGINENSKGSKI